MNIDPLLNAPRLEQTDRFPSPPLCPEIDSSPMYWSMIDDYEARSPTPAGSDIEYLDLSYFGIIPALLEDESQTSRWDGGEFALDGIGDPEMQIVDRTGTKFAVEDEIANANGAKTRQETLEGSSSHSHDHQKLDEKRGTETEISGSEVKKEAGILAFLSRLDVQENSGQPAPECELSSSDDELVSTPILQEPPLSLLNFLPPVATSSKRDPRAPQSESPVHFT